MKNLKTIAIALLVVFGTANLNAQTKKINASKSKINWVGKKITGQHEGTINLQEGALIFKGEKLVGGNFTVNMASISTTDLKAGEGKEKLDGHLKADDFFGTEKFPTATLVFKSIVAKGANAFNVSGDLTIKGIKNPITFDLATTANSATTKFNVDRTKYNIKYGSKSFFDSIGDKAIDNEFELSVALEF